MRLRNHDPPGASACADIAARRNHSALLHFLPVVATQGGPGNKGKLLCMPSYEKMNGANCLGLCACMRARHHASIAFRYLCILAFQHSCISAFVHLSISAPVQSWWSAVTHSRSDARALSFSHPCLLFQAQGSLRVSLCPRCSSLESLRNAASLSRWSSYLLLHARRRQVRGVDVYFPKHREGSQLCDAVVAFRPCRQRGFEWLCEKNIFLVAKIEKEWTITQRQRRDASSKYFPQKNVIFEPLQ